MRDEGRALPPIGDHLRPGDVDRVGELRADLTLLQSQLYGPGDESLFLRLRLQEELQKELAAWKKTLVTRFWQVVLALITTMTLATASVWWEQSATMLRMEQQIAGLEKRLP